MPLLEEDWRLLAGAKTMFQTLLKTDAFDIDHQTLSVSYFEGRTSSGALRYSAEIVFGPTGLDRFILDDDSIRNLEVRATRLAPTTLYSRTLADRAA
jgi:hypothetical protein